MIQFFKIFLLHFERALNFRSRIFVWFLTALLNPISLLIFWVAVYKEKGNVLSGWNLSNISSYYLLMIIASSFIIAHIEEDVAIRDIREGELVSYLLKPVSYFWMKFVSEVPWRIMQGMFGLGFFIIFFVLFKNLITLPSTPLLIFSSFIIIALAFFISFSLKMLVGLTAFWFIDFWGFQQVVEVTLLFLAGFVIPIDFFPAWLKTITFATPFPYMVYYPVLSLQSRLNLPEISHVIIMQAFWLIAMYFIYQFLWKRGVKRFTGVGQ